MRSTFERACSVWCRRENANETISAVLITCSRWNRLMDFRRAVCIVDEHEAFCVNFRVRVVNGRVNDFRACSFQKITNLAVHKSTIRYKCEFFIVIHNENFF